MKAHNEAHKSAHRRAHSFSTGGLFDDLWDDFDLFGDFDFNGFGSHFHSFDFGSSDREDIFEPAAKYQEVYNGRGLFLSSFVLYFRIVL